jgi:hypothetical protein
MPTAATQPTRKCSKRRRFEGRPTKQTEAITTQLSELIGLGLADDEAAAVVGIADHTLIRWKNDPGFCQKIKVGVAKRLAKRLAKIESGAEGWQGCGWLLERLYPTRFSKPEVQISLSNSFNQTVNALSITISPEEVKELNARGEETREKVRRMFEEYQQRRGGNGNGHGAGGQRTVEVQAEPVEKSEDLAPPISRKEGEEKPSVFWNLFASGERERIVEKATAIYVVKTIVDETVGRGLGNQAIVAFKHEPITVADVLAAIERLCGGSPAGWQTIQRKANFIASS